MHLRRFFLTTLIASLLITACAERTQPSADSSATAALPSATAAQAAPTDAPTPEPSPTPLPYQRPQYTLQLTLDYRFKKAEVVERILYPNLTGVVLDKLVLAVEPNLWSNCFTLKSITLEDGSTPSYTLDGQRLEIRPVGGLQPNTALTLNLQFSLAIPQIPSDLDPNKVRPQIFGFTARQINLVDWYPFVVPYDPATGWVLHDPWYYGEHLVYPGADFDVQVKPADPAYAPVLATSAPSEPDGEWTRYRLTAGRSFAISASTEYKVASAEAGPVKVYSYYFAFNEAAGQAALDAATKAVGIFSQHYGPYPHQKLSVVQGDFNDGMEFSGLFFLSFDFYNLYDGTPKGYLTIVAAHETSHQWWFETVANDQATQPWLDESLATYSERVFFESAYPDLVPWWWAYRVDYYQPEGYVDIPVADSGGFRPYTNAVYFRGAHFLEDLRTRIGDQAFFGFLQDYYQQEDGRIATSADFFRILRQHTSADFSDLLKAYFENNY